MDILNRLDKDVILFISSNQPSDIHERLWDKANTFMLWEVLGSTYLILFLGNNDAA